MGLCVWVCGSGCGCAYAVPPTCCPTNHWTYWMALVAFMCAMPASPGLLLSPPAAVCKKTVAVFLRL